VETKTVLELYYFKFIFKTIIHDNFILYLV